MIIENQLFSEKKWELVAVFEEIACMIAFAGVSEIEEVARDSAQLKFRHEWHANLCVIKHAFSIYFWNIENIFCTFRL